MIKVVIFDAHGVVLSGDRFQTHAKLTFSQKMHSWKNQLQKYTTNQARITDDISRLIKNHEWEKKSVDMLEYLFASEQAIDKKILPYIMQLRHKRILTMLTTNRDKESANYMENSMKLSLVFDTILSATDLGVQKPDIGFFRAIMHYVPERILKQEVLYWDDIQINVERAREFGFQAEVYKDFKDFQKKMVNYVDIPAPESV